MTGTMLGGLETVDGGDAGLVALLRAHGLPTDDLREPGRTFFRLGTPDGTTVGYVGLELHGREALLRSLVTDDGARGRGHGTRLVEHAASEAAALGVEDLYLLTTTAADFFAVRGFERVERRNVPPTIASTREFASLCPASATVMRRPLSRV
ncbi:arsenic resistance N-acetyltransferase ArsN2 [Arenibaculum pallidiluteum]|uniref:arsenic resistance N-acetyltransferase ArsN2 n=1 Tax=Arenibaculum pallidiluteum TaxID=2812559 RepID=UPI001A963C0F|nr:arsenic resistance N-acetyltransferase ArsN2 [Arenibaculum pallidiluteum]